MEPSHPIPLAEAHARLTAPGQRFETGVAVIRGVPTRIWRSVPTTARALFDSLQAHGDKDCLVHEDERVSYDAFARACRTLAAALRAAGLNKGDRLALAMRNLPEWPVALMGGLLAGAIVVPLNAWGTTAELAFALADSGSHFVICDGERLSRIRDAQAQCPALERIFAARAPDAADTLESIIGTPGDWHRLAAVALPDVGLDPEDDATIFYTSGTGGNPRGVLGTHRNLTTNIFATPFSMARNALRTPFAAPTVPALPRANLLTVPLFHVVGCLSILLPSLAAGGKVVMMRKFDADEALALIARERVTIAGGVPSIALRLLDKAQGRDLSSLTLLSYGGAPSPLDLAGRIAAALPHVAPGNGWGMTETSASCTMHSGPDYVMRPGSCGPALPVSAIKVMSDGRELPPGEIGELWAFGPNVAKAYWNRPADTAACFRDGWVRTGDLARIDEDGFCTIVDRLKDMVIRGGENIHCIEVEHVLCAHPQVADAALVGLAHPHLGEVPAAVVEARGLLKEEDLRAFAAARLAPFKLPVKILISPTPLPRNEGGKVVKSALKAALTMEWAS